MHRWIVQTTRRSGQRIVLFPMLVESVLKWGGGRTLGIAVVTSL